MRYNLPHDAAEVNPVTYHNCSRRDFLTRAGSCAVALTIGIDLPQGTARRQIDSRFSDRQKLNAFVTIEKSGIVTIIVHKSEMGQGVYTALPMLVAEELEVPWEHIRVESAPAAPDYYNTAWGAFQGTGASSSVSTAWKQLRTPGAAAREMLVAAASNCWTVSPSECRASAGYIVHLPTSRRLAFGELVETAADMTVPQEPQLKDKSQFKLIGKKVPRIDSPDKVTGTAVYGIDAAVPGMVIAAVLRPPVFGAKLVSFDSSNIAACWNAQIVPLSSGVAVVSDSFWKACRGRELLKASWTRERVAELSSERLFAKHASLASSPGRAAKNVGDVATALATAASILDLSYQAPYLAHAAMEPLNCTANVSGDRCDVWVGTQMQTTDKDAVCQITGLTNEQIHIHTLYLGGSFGRRANPHADFIKEAVELSKKLQRAVKVIWTREDDMRGGYYRPMHFSRLRIGLDASGKPVAWRHTVRPPEWAKSPFRRSRRRFATHYFAQPAPVSAAYRSHGSRLNIEVKHASMATNIRSSAITAQAAILRESGGPFSIETVVLDPPRADEVLVRNLACGVCHTDAIAANMVTLPAIFGHEGTGVVEAVGAAVTHFKVGAHVIACYPSCGNCQGCIDGRPYHCNYHMTLGFAGRRLDGSATVHATGIPISGAFFQQSSFASHSVVPACNLVSVSHHVDPVLRAAIPCGVLTGAGAILNTFALSARQSITVFGAGTVGLSAVMAAKLAGASPLIAVDVLEQRLEIARELGATHTVRVQDGAVAHQILEIKRGGVDFALETSGNEFALDAAISSLRTGGRCGMVIAPHMGKKYPFETSAIFKRAATLEGIIQGSAVPRAFLPRLLQLHASGELPIDRLVRVYGFDEINHAFQDAKAGRVVKPVIRIH